MSEPQNGKNQATKPLSDVSFTPTKDKTISHVLGEITWLLSQSKVHKNLFISDLEWMVMPAVLLEQFRIYNGPNSPAAVAMFAYVSKETDQRLRDGASRLRPDEWKAGDIPWLIELIAPFGAEAEILADLSAQIFDNKPFNFHSTQDGKRSVQSFSADDANKTREAVEKAKAPKAKK